MQTETVAERPGSQGPTVVAGLVTAAALACILFSFSTGDAALAARLVSDSGEDDCGGYMSFWLCPEVPITICECSWTAEYACSLNLERVDLSGDGHITAKEAEDLNEDGVVSAAEQARLDENHDGRTTKQEALALRRPPSGAKGYADESHPCFDFCCRGASAPPPVTKETVQPPPVGLAPPPLVSPPSPSPTATRLSILRVVSPPPPPPPSPPPQPPPSPTPSPPPPPPPPHPSSSPTPTCER